MFDELNIPQPGTVSRYPGTGAPQNVEHARTYQCFDLEQLMRGTLVQYERLGFYKMPTAREALEDPNWGINATSTVLDQVDKLARPTAASEAIQKFDVQRCVHVSPSVISSGGVAFELVHQMSVSGGMMVLEDVPTVFDEVTALDENGVAMFTYGGLNGVRPCLNELIHPDVNVTEPLRWRFALVWTDGPEFGPESTAPDLAYQGPVSPARVFGQYIIPPWDDARMGIEALLSNRQQFLVTSSAIARYWVVLTGPVDRFRVKVGARLGGFNQLAGRKGAALDAALIRRV